MNVIGHAIRSQRERAGKTLAEVAAAIGVSKSQLSLVESGKRSITEERVAEIERFLGIDDGRLVEAVRWQHTPPQVRAELSRLSRREQESRALAAKLRDVASATARKRGRGSATAAVLDRLLQSGELREWVQRHSGNIDDPIAAGRQIPIINSVSAGYPEEFTDLDYPAAIADDYIACPDVSDPHAFAARVVGDSMAPDYREGEVVVFSPVLDTPSGSDCFIRLQRDNETTFKRIYIEDDGKAIRLQPINPKYAPRTVAREDVTGMYRAVYVMRKV